MTFGLRHFELAVLTSLARIDSWKVLLLLSKLVARLHEIAESLARKNVAGGVSDCADIDKSFGYLSVALLELLEELTGDWTREHCAISKRKKTTASKSDMWEV